jgi:hypothetical protein
VFGEPLQERDYEMMAAPAFLVNALNESTKEERVA